MSQSSAELRISGNLTLEEVPRHFGDIKCRASLPSSVDLSAVERTDSSALALLLELKAMAKSLNQDIELKSPPPALLTLARLSGASGLLGWPNDQGEPITP